MWMRRVDDKDDLHYEDIVVCVDDLLIASKSAQLIVDALTSKHNFKLKDTGPISYHLGLNFTRDGNNDL